MPIKTKTLGTPNLVKWVQKRKAPLKKGQIRIEVVAHGSTKTYRTPWGPTTEKRDAGTSTRIWNSLKLKRDRNPVFFRANEIRTGSRLIQEASDRYWKSENPTLELFLEGLEVLGDFMVGTIKSHILRGQSAVGRMRPLDEKYAKRKERLGFGDQPILVKTGALLESLTTQFRIGGRPKPIIQRKKR